jgi:hypothetical protein
MTRAALARLDLCTAYGALAGECGKPAGHDGLHGFGVP